jgi:hypothetical protein
MLSLSIDIIYVASNNASFTGLRKAQPFNFEDANSQGGGQRKSTVNETTPPIIPFT